MGKAARNEKRKLRAGWYNSISSACITIGVVSPTVAYLIGALKSQIDVSLILLICVLCFGASSALHLIGQTQIEELED